MASLLVVAACTTASDARVTVDSLASGVPVVNSSGPIDGGRWSVSSERTLQPPVGTAAELVDPAQAVLAEDGLLYVVERRPVAIHVYANDGSLHQVIGREGEGPGEFRAAGIALNGDSLVVHDRALRRLTVFDRRTGTLRSSRQSGCCLGGAWVDESGNVVVQSGDKASETGERLRTFIRHHAGSMVDDTMYVAQRLADRQRQWNLGRLGPFETFQPIPLVPGTLAVPDVTGILVAWTGEYQLRLTQTGTDTMQIIARPGQPSG